MSLFDSFKSAAEVRKIRSNELQVQLSVTSGKQNFFLKPKDHFVVLRVNDDGFIYFDDIEGHYKITEFQWEGPRYQTVTTTSGVTKYNEKSRSSSVTQSHGRDKRTGRLIGAAVGTAILPGAGTLVGALVGTGNKKTSEVSQSRGGGRAKGSEQISSTTQEFEQEVAGMAYMHLSDPVSNFGFTFGFYCNSVIYGELLNVFSRSGYSPKSES